MKSEKSPKQNMPLTLATTSNWKYQQGKSYLRRFDIALEQATIELPESRNEDVVAVAREKAVFAYQKLKQPVIVIDGAFHIKSLDGFPKTFVKFSEKYVGARGILKLMQDTAERVYEWPNALYYIDGEVEKYFIGYIRGTVVANLPEDAVGNSFDLIQLPDGYTRTLSQMDADDLKHFEQHVWQPTIFKEFAQWFSAR